MAKEPKGEIMEEPVDDFGNPDDLMPIPDRFKGEKPTEALQSSVRAPEPEIRALPVKRVSGIVEPGSPAVIRARRDAYLANSRR